MEKDRPTSRKQETVADGSLGSHVNSRRRVQQSAMVEAMGEEFLRKHFPDMDPDVISCKRIATFEELIQLRAMYYNCIYASSSW